MLISEEFDEFFVEAIGGLGPYLDDIVCIGGCASALYRAHPSAVAVSLPQLVTYDLDLATEQKVPLRGNRSIAQLLEDVGLVEEMLGSNRQAITKYRPTDQRIAADIEFLCSASGMKGANARVSPPVSCAVQKDLHAQPLRYLELLLFNTWTVTPERIGGQLGALKGLRIRIPNPSAYVVQKTLIQDQGRKRESMAKDFYYIFEVSVVFRNALDQIAEEYKALASQSPSKWRRRFSVKIAEAFAGPDAEGTQMAWDVYRFMPRQFEAGLYVDPNIIAASVGRMIGAMIT